MTHPDVLEQAPTREDVSSAPINSAPGSTMSKPFRDTASTLPWKEDSASEGEHERPVREKLKKTSIASMPDHRTARTADPNSDLDEFGRPEVTVKSTRKSTPDESYPRGRALRKRSFDDTEIDPAERSLDRGSRKRSRELSNGEEAVNVTENQANHMAAPAATLEKAPEGDKVESIDVDKDDSDRPGTADNAADPEVSSEDKRQNILSPKKKRSRDQFDKDQVQRADSEIAPLVSEDADHDPNSIARSSRTTREEPEKKRHRDTSQDVPEKRDQEEKKIPPTSGFANTSAMSPFGASLPNKTPDAASNSVLHENPTNQPQTSSTAFAKSGFGALSGATSPFGALGGSSTQRGASPFGTMGAPKPSNSGFGGPSAGPTSQNVGGFGGLSTPGGSVFGSGASGFGKLGGGPSGSVGRGVDFSSKGAPGIVGLSDKPKKPFGVAADADNDNDSNNDDESESSETEALGDSKDTEEKTFRTQEVETGEEGEDTLFTGRAKLFYFNKKEKVWKERGNGTLKLNTSISTARDSEPPTSEDGDEEEGAAKGQKKSARLIMRAEGVLRVVLNVPLYKGMSLGDREGNAPTGKAVITTAYEDGEPTMFQIRFGTNTTALELYHRAAEMQSFL
ncbi:MAG: hypothetical protein M1837_006335 [Sclerophora amabilis]|nr:MAG: hypothetical protein M1837_006335 [Sclerophora amabilis]